MVDERETLHALLQYQRDSLVRKVAGVDDEAARQSPVGSGTTLLWLMKHMTRAESLWILHRFAGQDTLVRYDSVHPEAPSGLPSTATKGSAQRADAAGGRRPDLSEPCRNTGDDAPSVFDGSHAPGCRRPLATLVTPIFCES